MDLKDTICEIAASLGFQRTVIAGLEPMLAERAEFEQWLSRGFAAGMDYLKRNPHVRTSPQLLYPGSRSAIVVSASYYTEPPADPGPSFGRVARYAVGLDYHAVLKAKLRQLKSQLEMRLGRPLLGKAWTDDVALFEQGFARRHGLGFAGKNTLIIGPKLMGSYFFVAELFTDLELEPDEPYSGTCGKCFRCGAICPTSAIVDSGVLDAGLCISYLTIENKNGIPLELRPRIGEWVFGCDLCQEACPYNQRPPSTPWAEFRPQSGVGHYLDLRQVLAIKSEEDFRARFGHTALRRPKRRGLLRNALVVLGNRRPEDCFEELCEFARSESDPMLREHAIWAIAQYGHGKAKQALTAIYLREPETSVKARVEEYLTLC
ncbi:MAG TPA: tRNA epoxyqueuosine(34) reductase QueG [Candidatus Obscuribacterales bacterium]